MFFDSSDAGPTIFIIIMVIVVIIACYLLSLMKTGATNTGTSSRFKKYIRSIKPALETKVKKILISGTDDEFRQFCENIQKRINYKYNVKGTARYNTVMKRTLLNVINTYTLEIPETRIREIAAFFPLLRRAYFGPEITRKIYAKSTKERKFHFRVKNDEKIPELRSPIDIAYFFGISVNRLMGYCYTQYSQRRGHYLKAKKLYLRNTPKKDRKKKRFVENKSRFYTRYFIAKRSQIPSHFEIPLDREEASLLHPMVHHLINQTTRREDIERPPSPLKETEQEQIWVKGKWVYHYSKKRVITHGMKRRLISVPRYGLKRMQQKILQQILDKVELKPYCTGFYRGGSTVLNAKPHLGNATMLKMDLANFFPSLRIEHVLQVFQGFGYNRAVAGILACLCTDFYYGNRFMPQGAPTSPMIGNLYCSILDARLAALWSKAGFKYTRYADDITLSSDDPRIRVNGLIQTSYGIIKSEKLIPKYSKTRIFRQSHRKEVTGIIVNKKLNINSEWVKNFRAELHNYTKHGIPADDGMKIVCKLQGKLSYLSMVNPEKALKYRSQVQNLLNLQKSTK